jgi:beta-glucanase (GH16 family)
MKAAPGTGIVSSMVMQSDDLDEIDLEWLGGDSSQVQSNYFGKGQTTTYNRGAFEANPNNQDAFHTYTVDWTSEQIVWQIDGVTVRALTAADAEANQYPQTPMQLKLGIWAGGDPSNPPGTIQWAGGDTNYADGPFTMTVQSVSATDYSTGTEYTYDGTSGTWQSIKSTGGSVNGNLGGSVAESMSSAAAAAPQVTEVSSGAPLPFDGTHKDSSTTPLPSIWPWVTTATSMQTVASQTSIPGLPSGWTISASGKVVPPSSAPVIDIPTRFVYLVFACFGGGLLFGGGPWF